MGGDISTLKHVFSHALHAAPVESVLIGIDFFMFNGLRQQKYPYPKLLITHAEKPERFVRGLVLTLFTPEIFKASTKTLRKQRPEDNKYLSTGQRNNTRDISKALKDGYLRGFEKFEIGFTRTDWTNCKNNKFLFSGRNADTMEVFTKILEEAKAQNVDVRVFMSPVHARLLETLHAAGLWEVFEQWKREIVHRIESVNSMYPGAPIPLWDFSGYHVYSEEPVPDKPGVAMGWYIDSSHFNEDLGKIMLGIMYGSADYSDNFASKLSGANVEERLSLIRKNQKEYRNKNLAQYESFEIRAEKYLSEKRERGKDCPNKVI